MDILDFMDASSGDRTRSYIDPNQVEYTYDYDALGRVKTLKLSGENPITFEYVYDAKYNLNAIHQGLFQATYSNFQNGVPATMDWVDPSLNKTFNLTTDDGRLNQETKEFVNGRLKILNSIGKSSLVW